MIRHKENQIQQVIAAWLRGRGILFCASIAGININNMAAAVRAKKSGYNAGFPDLFIYEPRGIFHGMAIEVKCRSYAKTNQKIWKRELLNRNYYAIIVPGNKDFSEAIEFIKSEVDYYMSLKKGD